MGYTTNEGGGVSATAWMILPVRVKANRQKANTCFFKGLLQRLPAEGVAQT